MATTYFTSDQNNIRRVIEVTFIYLSILACFVSTSHKHITKLKVFRGFSGLKWVEDQNSYTWHFIFFVLIVIQNGESFLKLVSAIF